MSNKVKLLFISIVFSSSLALIAFVYSQDVLAIVSKNWIVQDQFALFNAGLSGKDVAITQGLKGGANTLELTTADSRNIQATRMLIRGATDYADMEFYSGPRGSEVVRMKIGGSSGDILWGTGIGTLSTDQGASIELGGMGVPYVDFKNDVNADFDARLMLTGDDTFNITGSRVGIGIDYPQTKLDVNGDIATRNSFPITSNNNNLAGVGLGWLGDQARIRMGGDGPGAKNGLSIQEVGEVTLLKIDETNGTLNLTSDYSTICIGKC